MSRTAASASVERLASGEKHANRMPSTDCVSRLAKVRLKVGRGAGGDEAHALLVDAFDRFVDLGNATAAAVL